MGSAPSRDAQWHTSRVLRCSGTNPKAFGVVLTASMHSHPSLRSSGTNSNALPSLLTEMVHNHTSLRPSGTNSNALPSVLTACRHMPRVLKRAGTNSNAPPSEDTAVSHIPYSRRPSGMCLRSFPSLPRICLRAQAPIHSMCSSGTNSNAPSSLHNASRQIPYVRQASGTSPRPARPSRSASPHSASVMVTEASLVAVSTIMVILLTILTDNWSVIS